MATKTTIAMAKRDEAQLAVASEVAAMFGEENAVKIPVDAPLPQVKILRESPMFEMPDGEPAKGLEGHIIYWTNANVYYDSPFGEGEANFPVCVSSTGVRADGGEHMETYYDIEKNEAAPQWCVKCKYNQFGSAPAKNGEESRAKACQNTIRLYLLLDGDVLPCVLKAPPSSLGKKDSLMRWLTNVNNITAKAGFKGKYQLVRVKLSLHRKDFSSGMSASVLDVETDHVLDMTSEDEKAKALELGALYQQFMETYFKRIKTDVATEKQEAGVEGNDGIPI